MNFSAVFTECMTALGATEKLRRRFIAPAGLHLPHVRQIIPTLRALNTHRRQSSKLLLFLANHGDWLLRWLFNNLRKRRNLHISRRFHKSTLRTRKHQNVLPTPFPLGGNHPRSTLRTKLHQVFTISDSLCKGFAAFKSFPTMAQEILLLYAKLSPAPSSNLKL